MVTKAGGMNRFSWAVDGAGRQFIIEKQTETHQHCELLCVIPGESPLSAIDELIKCGVTK